jgi:hypothetical protein
MSKFSLTKKIVHYYGLIWIFEFYALRKLLNSTQTVYPLYFLLNQFANALNLLTFFWQPSK